MIVHRDRPRELHWYHAGPMLFGDWGTSRLYVLGLCFFYAQHGSLWYMLAISLLLLAVGWAYQVICRLYPDGGGVYSSARQRSEFLGLIGGLLLCADYVVTGAISALVAFHYLPVPLPFVWAAVSIVALGVINYFGPRHSGRLALIVAIVTVALTLTIVFAAVPSLGQVRVDPPHGTIGQTWSRFTSAILAISGVEAVANMTGIMVQPVHRTARRAILPVMFEIAILNIVLTVAMQALPLEVLGNGDPSQAYLAHRDDMMRLLADHYVGPAFGACASLVFAALLLSAVNTAVSDLVSIQFMMARDRELPRLFSGLNVWGMPVAPLVVAIAMPLVVVLAVPDVAHLADLYAIGVVGAVAVNLGTTATNFSLQMKQWERVGMMLLGVLMIVIWVTIAWEKPWALLFATSTVALGLGARWITQHLEEIRGWLLASARAASKVAAAAAPASTPSVAVSGAAASPPPPAAALKILVATTGNPKLLEFAIEEAKHRTAELLVLFVRRLAVQLKGPVPRLTADRDPDAQKVFEDARSLAAQAGIQVKTLYAVAEDVGEAILDLAVTHGADALILGSTKRGALWRVMKGDVIQQVATYLPPRIRLLIHA